MQGEDAPFCFQQQGFSNEKFDGEILIDLNMGRNATLISGNAADIHTVNNPRRQGYLDIGPQTNYRGPQKNEDLFSWADATMRSYKEGLGLGLGMENQPYRTMSEKDRRRIIEQKARKKLDAAFRGVRHGLAIHGIESKGRAEDLVALTELCKTLTERNLFLNDQLLRRMA